MFDQGGSQRFFLTGGTGFIGNRLARLLIEEGHLVVLLVRTPHAARDLQSLGAVIVQGDIKDREAVRRGMAGADGIFHLAAQYTFGRGSHASMVATNVGGTRNVLSVMRELGVRKGVYTSSVAVFADTGGAVVDENFFRSGFQPTEYARTKWIAHYDVARTMIFDGLPLVIVQPGIVYGPGDHSVIADMMTAFLARKLPFAPADFSVSWTHVDDVVLGHYLAMTRGRTGETYLLAGPSHTLYDALAEVARLVRRRPPPIRLGPQSLLAASRFVRLVEGFAPVPPHLSSEVLRMCAGKSLTVSSARAERELGYSSRSLSSGLKGTVTDLFSRMTEDKSRREGR